MLGDFPLFPNTILFMNNSTINIISQILLLLLKKQKNFRSSAVENDKDINFINLSAALRKTINYNDAKTKKTPFPC